MSDTKWRKLFLAVERLNLDLPLCRIKWIEFPTPRVLSTPSCRFHPAPRKFLPSLRPFFEFTEFGPADLVSIEWLEFPRSVVQVGNLMGRRDGTVYEQDVERAEQALKLVARFPMELTESGLRITGHLR